jgi:hypothetical protein
MYLKNKYTMEMQASVIIISNFIVLLNLGFTNYNSTSLLTKYIIIIYYWMRD